MKGLSMKTVGSALSCSMVGFRSAKGRSFRGVKGDKLVLFQAVLALAAPFLAAQIAAAADRPAIPERPIAVKKELLFADDFESAERSPLWHRVVPTFAFEGGALKGTQTRDKTIPAADGKPAVVAHAAVHGLEVPTA